MRTVKLEVVELSPLWKEGLMQRFLARIEKQGSGGCWLWKGLLNKSRGGYGFFELTIEGSRYHLRAHRLSWMLHYGCPGKMFVCHTCDTPGCVNPEHLFLGDPRENAQDMMAKGRHWRQLNEQA